MKKITINQTTFHVTKDSYLFLTKYMERIQTYIKSHHLDADLYHDILVWIEEKLQEMHQKNNTITQKDCIKIVNSLGEPEEIFDGEEIHKSPTHSIQPQAKGIKKLLNKKLLYYFFGAIFVAFMIAATSGIIIPFFIVWAIFYWIISLFSEKKSIGEVIKYSLKKIMKTVQWLWKNIFSLLRIFIFCGVWLLFFAVILMIITLLWAYFADFSLNNIYFFALVPKTFAVSGIFLVIGLLLLGIAAFLYGIKKKSVSLQYIIFASSCLVIGIGAGSLTWFSLFSSYNGQSGKQINHSQSLAIPQTDSVYQLDVLQREDRNFTSFIWNRSVQLVASDDEYLTVHTKTTWLWPDNLANTISWSLQSFSLRQIGENIFIDFSEKDTFSTKVPFVPMETDITTMYVPKTMKFTWRPGIDVELPDNVKQYEPSITIHSCEYYFYDKAKEAFTCHISNKELNKILDERIITPLTWHEISELSPIKHKDHSKNNYYSSDGFSDWKITNISREWEIITIKYEDRWLHITASAKLQERTDYIPQKRDKNHILGTDSPFIIDDFVIINITKKQESYSKKYYKNPGMIDKCLFGCPLWNE